MTLIFAAWAVHFVRARRIVFYLGRHGVKLAPAFMLSLAVVGLKLGEAFHSFAAMCGFAVALQATACGFAARTSKRTLREPPWSKLEVASVIFVAAFVLLIPLADSACHNFVISSYLRGNIPPTASNAPHVPLPYHGLYDALVAVIVHALPVDFELGMDIVSVALLLVIVLNLQAAAREVWSHATVRVWAIVFFLLAFGPTFVRLFDEGMMGLHGRMAQVYPDLLRRRPMALSHALGSFVIAILLPYAKRHALARPQLCLALPALWLLPHASEEMLLFVGVLALPLVVCGRLPWPAVIAAIASLSYGVWDAQVFWPKTTMDPEIVFRPQPGFAWPLTLPYWKTAHAGLPLLSWQALKLLFEELGPVFALSFGFVAWRGSSPQRLLLLPFVAGFSAAVCMHLGPWPKADVDRFLFFSVQLVFFTAPAWLVPLWEKQTGAVERWAVGTVFATTILSGLVYPAWRGATKARSWNSAWQERPGHDLRAALGKVGPKQMVLSDEHMSQNLVDAGFVVVAPMLRNNLNNVDEANFNAYVAKHKQEADWWFLPARDLGVLQGDTRVEATFDDYVLTKPRR
ncbi:MAG: hypothetical protein SF187_25240 [Deltaproteobacteria bacterium]|nr:hypothetical protein [Deltaproteobacteria bacterium]